MATFLVCCWVSFKSSTLEYMFMEQIWPTSLTPWCGSTLSWNLLMDSENYCNKLSSSTALGHIMETQLNLEAAQWYLRDGSRLASTVRSSLHHYVLFFAFSLSPNSSICLKIHAGSPQQYHWNWKELAQLNPMYSPKPNSHNKCYPCMHESAYPHHKTSLFALMRSMQRKL